MALTNCTISTGVLTKIGGQVIGSDNMNLTITPTTHHSVTASNFTVGTIPTGVDSISITDNGTPGTFTNTLNVLVDLTNSFTMPSQNKTITVDVDGAGDKGEVLQRTIFLKEVQATGSNFSQSLVSGPGITASSNNNTGTKPAGSYVLLFTRTLTTSSTYYFPVEPSFSITSADETHVSRYTVETTRTYLDNGSNELPLQVIAFKVYYLVPDDNVIAADLDTITFSATAAIIYHPSREITNLLFNTSNIPNKGGTKVFQIYGTVGAGYNFNVVDAASTVIVTNGNYTNQIIGDKGVNTHVVTFNSSDIGAGFTDRTYNITITTATTSPTTSLGSNISTSSPMYAVFQKANVLLTLTRSNWNGTGQTLGSPTTALRSFIPSYSFGDLEIGNTIPWSFTAGLPNSSTIVKRRDVVETDFTTVGGGKSNFEIALTKADIIQTNAYTLTMDWEVSVLDTGPVSKSLVIDLNSIINTPTTVYAQSVNIPHNTATTINLTSNDINGDTPTYSIVGPPTKGAVTVVASTGVATYTPTTGNSGNDTFTYKVNDTFQDSGNATVTCTIANSGSSAPTFNSVFSWNDSEVNNNYSIIGSNAFQGTVLYNNSTSAGSSSFKANMTSWALDSLHVGFPTYVDNLGDITIDWEFRYNGGLLNNGVASINTGSSSINQGAQTGNITVQQVTVSVPNSHNSGNGLISGGGYSFNWKLKYDNISQ